MAGYVVPPLDGITDLMAADFQCRFPDRNVSRFSDNWKRIRVFALGVLSLHYHAKTIEDDLWPDTCGGLDSNPPSPMLDRHGFIRGVLRKPATAAYATAALRVTGTPGSSITLNTEVTDPTDGTNYIITGSFTVGAGGYVDCDLSGDDRNYPTDTSGVGVQTRKGVGEKLTLTSPPAGVQGQAVLVAALNNGGVDRETDSAYRARILNRIAQPGMGGNANDYAQWVLDQPGAVSAYVYPRRNGLGSVDVAFAVGGSGADRVPTSPEIAAVQAAVDLVRPVSMKMFRVLTVTPQLVQVELGVVPIDGAQWAYDWNDTAPAQVSAWNAGTRVLTFVARPPDMVGGDRLVYKNATVTNDGSELVVESLGPGVNDVVITAESLTAANVAAPPEVGARVTAGGPLVEPIRQAILALGDALGTGRGVDPSLVAGGWDDTLRTSQIFKVAQLTPGVLETTPINPTSNVVATNTPPASSVNMIVINQVIVRKV